MFLYTGEKSEREDTEIKLKAQSHRKGHVLTDKLPLKRKKEGYDNSSALWLCVGDEKLYGYIIRHGVVG